MPQSYHFGSYEVLKIGGKLTLKCFTGIDEAVLEIPAKLNSMPVCVIDKYAFLNCKNIERVIIPQGVKEIRSGAFNGCDALREIVIARSVEIIEADAFSHREDIVIYCYGGSYGLEYARQNKYEYRDAEDLDIQAKTIMTEFMQETEIKKEPETKFSVNSSGFTGSAYTANSYQSSACTSGYVAGSVAGTLLLDNEFENDTDWLNNETTRDRLDFDLLGTGYDSYDLEWMDEDERDEILWDNGLDPFDYDFYDLDE